jgi:hypothetical protein
MKNIISLWRNLFRAIEIAKVGNYSISVYFDSDYKNGFDDYESIKNFCKGWFNNFVSDGDIKIELSKPYDYVTYINTDTLESISNRVLNTLNFKKPEIILCDVSKELLKTSTRRNDFSLRQVENIKEISATIAHIELSETIRVEHVAEAIQYVHNMPNDDYLNAEAKTKVFGNIISIKLGEIDTHCINEAISYLQGLLNDNK